MYIGDYAKALGTISEFLGVNGINITTPMLIAQMKKDKVIKLKYQMSDGVYRTIDLCPKNENLPYI